ncbi:hypothetical protein C1645_825178 [Glomus cerebriforme]|uniref:Uncharacterized protein n=1 Tax=Glomus cerebriforme TaxID=658196 RepID=A0A397SSS8_9GLOM|nr:hypothetical protein C1645_825178 [Glomus cerebriforme]
MNKISSTTSYHRKFSVNCPTLSCKIIEITKNNKYHIGSKFGIVEVCYSARELKPLGTTDFSKLYEIPSGEVSIREAACFQSAGSVPGGLCNCKSEYSNNKCHCKKLEDNIKSGYTCESDVAVKIYLSASKAVNKTYNNLFNNNKTQYSGFSVLGFDNENIT